MSEVIANTPEHDATLAVQAIVDNGDVRQAHSRRPLLVTAAGVASSASFVEAVGGYYPITIDGLTISDVRFSVEPLISAPTWAGGSLAVGACVYAGRRWQEKRRVMHAEELQATVRQKAGVQVDIEVSGKRKRRQTTAVWYGADAAGANDAEQSDEQLVEQFDDLVGFAERSGINNISAGSDWLQKMLDSETPQPKPRIDQSAPDTPPQAAKEQLSDYGHLVDGRTSHIHKRSVHDPTAPENRLVMTLAKAQDLREVLIERVGGTFASKLVALIESSQGSSNVAAAYEAYRATKDDASRKRLLRTLHHEITSTIDEASMSVAPEDRTQKGQKDRGGTVSSISGNTLIVVSQSVGTYGKPSGAIMYSGPLLRYTRSENLNQLNQKLRRGEGDKAGLEARIALREHIITGDNQPDQTKESGATATNQATAESPQTLFEKISETPLRRGPQLLQRRRRNKHRDALLYGSGRSGIRRRAQRAGSAILLTTIAYAGGFQAGATVEDGHTAVETYAQEQFDKKHPVQNEYDKLREKQREDAYKNLPYGLPYIIDGMHKHQEFTYQVHGRTAQGLSPFLPQWLADQAAPYFEANTSNLKIPQIDVRQAYQSNKYGNMQYGDVPLSEEQRQLGVYNIKMLGDRSAGGYWVTDTYNTLSLSEVENGGMPPLDGITVEASRTEDRFGVAKWLPTAPPPEITPEFAVITDYVASKYGSFDSFQLPYQLGTRIVAARLVEADMKAPKYGTVTKIALNVPVDEPLDTPMESPNRIVGVDVPTGYATEFSHPQLEYWLAEDKNPKTIPYSTAPTKLEYGNTFPRIIEPIGKATQAAVKAELGLSATATDNEVFAAIKAKNYSYTPYTDAKAWTTTQVVTGAQQQIAAVAKHTAQLPSENCNTSGLTLAVATGGTFNGRPISEISGYNNTSKTDVLTIGESHTWFANDLGQIIDPTPSGFEKTATAAEPSKNHMSPQEIAGLAGAVIIGAAGYRRRQAIAEVTSGYRHYGALKTLSGNSASQHHALSVVQHHMDSRPGASFVKEGYELVEAVPLAQRVRNNPMSAKDTKFFAKTVASDGRYNPKDRRAAAKLLRQYPRMQNALKWADRNFSATKT